MTRNPFRLLIGGAALAIALAAPAMAQNSAGSATADRASSGDNTAVGEIIVTARKQSEKLKDVPIAITVLSGRSLTESGTSNALSLTQLTPGLNFYANQTVAQPTIRGVTSSSAAPGDASNVAIYVDGVYQPYQGANYFNLFDVEQVEVLKGPQGTLFGRNATGGAINVTTRQPTYEANASFDLTAARFGEIKVMGYANAPLVADRVALSLAGYYDADDGFKSNVFTGQSVGRTRDRVIRGKLRLDPIDGLKIILTGEYINNYTESTTTGQSYQGNLVARRTAPTAIITTVPNQVALNLPAHTAIKGPRGNLRVEWETPLGLLTSITAYQKNDSDQISDSDATQLPIQNTYVQFHGKDWTQEFNLASDNSGPLSWIIGAFYFDEHAETVTQVDAGVAPAFTTVKRSTDNILDVYTKSYAVYGEATLKLTEQLSAVLGARWSSDHIHYTGTNFLTAASVAAATTSSAFTPRAALRYALTPGLTTFFTYSRGFKSAVFPSQSFLTTPVKPEILDSFELGIKGRLASTLSINASAYYYDYKNLQVQAYGQNTSVQTLRNASNAKIKGVEVELRWEPIPNLDVRATSAWIHARYADFPTSQGFFPVAGGGNTVVQTDVSGNHMIRQPDWTGSVAVAYTQPLPSGSLRFMANSYWSSRIYYDAVNLASQPRHNITNASATWRPEDERWSLGVFANNVFNTHYITSFFVSGTGYVVNYARPATYGVRVGFKL